MNKDKPIKCQNCIYKEWDDVFGFVCQHKTSMEGIEAEKNFYRINEVEECNFYEVINPIKKPPLGLEPEWSWRMRTIRKRLIDIISARDRYIEAGFEYPSEWDKEENKLLKELSSWYGQMD